MKKNIPLKKQLTFKTNVSEITSIALENTLKEKNNIVEGELIINGTYKIADTSTKVDNFEFIIPINIEIDEKYKTEDIVMDISDFYYEIINNNILEVNIEIMLDNLQEKSIEEEPAIKKEQVENITIQKEERCIEEETEIKENEKEIEKNNKIDIFNNFSNEIDDYTTYHVYIVREQDTLETIISKYETTKEKISEYNNINELKIGDKIIIPEKTNA